MKARFHARGVTLVELIAFIIIVGLLVGGLMGGFGATMLGSGMSKQVTQALQLAQERMELIRARKDVLGFAAFAPLTSDPCNPPATAHPACGGSQAVSGKTVTATVTLDSTVYSVSATIEDDTALIPAPFNDGNYKTITVTVNDASGARFSELQMAVANY